MAKALKNVSGEPFSRLLPDPVLFRSQIITRRYSLDRISVVAKIFQKFFKEIFAAAGGHPHDYSRPEQARRLADDLLFMKDGKIIPA